MKELTADGETPFLADDPASTVIVADSDTPCHWPACKITVNGQTYCDEGRNCNG